jgi:hypothetical protein
MRRSIIFISLLMIAGSAMAQSSKFAATYDTDTVMVDAHAGPGISLCGVFNGVTHCAQNPPPVAEVDMAQLHVAQWKEILGTVSAQVELLTFTKVKGKNEGGTTTAIAEGTMRAGMIVAPEGESPDCAVAFGVYDEGGDNLFAPPGPVTFASRVQELSIAVDLDVVGSIPGYCDEQCIEDNLGIEGSVTVALGLDTTAAHSFQFIAENLDSGDYDVVACYDLSAFAYVSGVDLDADSEAYSKVVLGPRIITAQEVRATKTGIIDETGTD